eukprot:COSAG02_NODE_321_length_24780_cov_11.623962_1_plen_93_part_00
MNVESVRIEDGFVSSTESKLRTTAHPSDRLESLLFLADHQGNLHCFDAVQDGILTQPVKGTQRLFVAGGAALVGPGAPAARSESWFFTAVPW